MSDTTLCVKVLPDGSERTFDRVSVTGRREMDAVIIDIPGFAFLIFDKADATALSAQLHKALKRLA